MSSFKKYLNNTMQPSGIYIYNRARAPAFLYNARRPWFVAMGCAQQPKCVALGLAKMNKSVKCQRQRQGGSFLFSLTAPSWRAPILWLAPNTASRFNLYGVLEPLCCAQRLPPPHQEPTKYIIRIRKEEKEELPVLFLFPIIFIL